MNKFCTIFLLLISVSVLGQDGYNYFIPFTDKEDTPYSVSAPSEFLSVRSVARRERQQIPVTERDLPVDPNYLFSVQTLNGVKLRYPLKWLNGGVFRISDTTVLAEIKEKEFVRGDEVVKLSPITDSATGKTRIHRKKEYSGEEITDFNYGESEFQVKHISADTLHTLGFKGHRITIAVFDAGFTGARDLKGLQHIWEQERVPDVHDFVALGQNTVYSGSTHGTFVLGVMAAYDPGTVIGTAPDANYILLKTENEETEYLIEEYNWAAAAEYADSAGADIINSSLGYTEFDDESQSHTYKALNGDSTPVTRAANTAAQTGMLVVNSAGNLGNDDWEYISAPADGKHVLSVGGTDQDSSGLNFSGIGPNAADEIKPDVSAFGRGVVSPGSEKSGTRSASGTSFATPLISGAAACLWQAYRELSAEELHNLIVESAHLYQQPDNKLGYGIPSFKKAYRDLEAQSVDSIIKERGKTIAFPNPATGEVTIISPQTGDYKIHDMNGNLVKSGYINHKLILSLDDLPRGIYIFSIGDERVKIVYK